MKQREGSIHNGSEAWRLRHNEFAMSNVNSRDYMTTHNANYAWVQPRIV